MLSPTTAVILTSLTYSLAGPLLLAADPKVDFSGSYVLKGSKGAFDAKTTSGSMRITQSDTSIEVLKTVDGASYLSTFKLDGSDGEYTSPGGVKGVGRVRIKGKKLVLDTLVAPRVRPNSEPVQMHTREQWELSPDSKTLTIRSEVDFPNSGLGGFSPVEPWSEIYTRK